MHCIVSLIWFLQSKDHTYSYSRYVQWYSSRCTLQLPFVWLFGSNPAETSSWARPPYEASLSSRSHSSALLVWMGTSRNNHFCSPVTQPPSKNGLLATRQLSCLDASGLDQRCYCTTPLHTYVQYMSCTHFIHLHMDELLNSRQTHKQGDSRRRRNRLAPHPSKRAAGSSHRMEMLHTTPA